MLLSVRPSVLVCVCVCSCVGVRVPFARLCDYVVCVCVYVVV